MVYQVYSLLNYRTEGYFLLRYHARVVKLVYTLASGVSDRKIVLVRVQSRALLKFKYIITQF